MKIILQLFVLIVCFNASVYAQSKTALIKVTYLDGKTQTPEAGAKMRLVEIHDKKFYEFITDSVGRHDVRVAQGKEYKVWVWFLGEWVEYDGTLPIPVEDANITITFTIEKPFVEYISTEILNIHFDINKADIKKESLPALATLLGKLKESPTRKIEIAGHTDNQGNDADNQILSQKRAESVRGYLIQKGIDANRLVAKGYGESSPVADNATPVGRAENRRTEIRVISE